MLEKLFKLKENDTSMSRELVAGLTNFMTISYIVFVQPSLLSQTGMNAGAVMVATCVSSAIATFAMAFLTNYPVVLAPGMGLNAYFVFDVCLGSNLPWQEALGIVCIAGLLFFILSFVGVRESHHGMRCRLRFRTQLLSGSGSSIAFIGLRMSGIITKDPATFVTLGALDSKPVLLSLFGIAVILTLIARRVRGGILIGILIAAAANLIFGVTNYDGIVAVPPSIEPIFFKLQVPNIFTRLELIPVLFVFFAIDMFDSIGTLTAIGFRAQLMEEGKLAKARSALMTDAASTVGGTCLGTSTVTCYIESATGIAEGGRTGLTAVFTGICMLLALLFEPLVKIIGGGYPINPIINPIIGPALIVVGGLMLRNISQIDWDDITEAVPAFLTMLMMPFSFSITDGIAFGIISLAFLKLVTGRSREIHPIIYYFALFFIACYIGDL